MAQTDRRRHTLLCLDLESGSSALCRYAAWQAERCDDQIQVLHVYHEDLDEEGQHRCRQEILALLNAVGIKQDTTEISLQPGIPDDVIPAYSQAQGVDLILLGRRQRSRVEKLYVGSTTSAVICAVMLPITVVPLTRETTPAPSGP